MTAGSLVPLEMEAQLSPRVIRILGGNPGMMTLQGTNSYIIGTGKKRILVDTSEPEIPLYTDKLKEVLLKNDIGLQEILLTHHHGDHVGAIAAVINDVLGGERIPIKKLPFKDNRKEDVINDNSLHYQYLEDGEIIKTDGATLKVIHTPGHCCDHMAIYLQEDEAILSGDCILGQGTTVFDDLYELIQSLKLLLNYPCKIIYPGHGPIIKDAHSKIREYISHRKEREDQILNVMRSLSGKLASSMELTKIVYKDIPESYLLAAENNLVLTLKKLLIENKVAKVGDDDLGEIKWELRKF
ncbi:Beta-lactamase-like protein 2 [Trichoplax sp. H2]|uniref:Metallo-beta-lactamase domain-containing protein n=1 Tax=Trichoplax adhaerens TaxID=10228 RepID=B3SA44_TRIAD|nr:hypothetical protein TRIADDRAFT_61129 [Trichoplax adhaerens]EDV20455.1 hypothetical protein TRIADDRAFT_61129 [Trichoplax adhaerens]RDD36772.1 Beta-lactamase-like protein 2 [Trichoplax sp. H2]|eukprot:XP_002117149.1 hypothetical protein TRIADDRAFT_61129 [Trichoplax adhaerens]